jgi:hypothetical protein
MNYQTADDSRNAISDASRHQAANAAAATAEAEVRYGLRAFADSFMDALGGDFLADCDPAELKRRHCGADLSARMRANGRVLRAQRAVHCLYRKLLDAAELTAEERALAEHAQDLAEAYAARETARRYRSEGL